MAATHKVALGIDLGVDFATLGRHLNLVGDRIEQVGKTHALKLGATVQDVAGGKLDPEKLGGAVAQIGAKLSAGLASGVRASAGLLVGMGTHINAILDRMAGATVTMFRRIDSAMKFPIFRTALSTAQQELTNFTKVIGRGPLTTLDKAAGGAYGKIGRVAARMARELVESLRTGLDAALASLGGQLTAALGGAIRTAAAAAVAALEGVQAELGKVVAGLGKVKAEAQGAVPILGEMAAAAKTAAAPAPSFLQGPIPPRSQVPGVGRRIGVARFVGPVTSAGLANAPAATPAPAVATAPAATAVAPAPAAVPAPQWKPAPIRPAGDLFQSFVKEGVAAAKVVAGSVGKLGPVLKGVGTVGYYSFRTLAQVAAAFVSVPLRGVNAIYGLRNFLTSLGDVGKKSFHDLYESHGLFVSALLLGARAVAGLTSRLFHLGTFNVFRKHEEGARGAARASEGLTSRLFHLGTFNVFRKHEEGARGAANAFTALGRTAQSVGGQILAALGVVGVIYQVVTFLKNGVKAASDLNDTVFQSQAVFGDSFGAVQAQAAQMSRAFGITRRAQLEMASGFGSFAQGAGMAEDDSAEFANRMTRMAADLSSAVGIPFKDAGDKIRSGLGGASEALREFGVWVDEDKTRAVAGIQAVNALAASHHRVSKAAATVRKVGTTGVHQAHVTRARAPLHAPRRRAGRGQKEELDDLTKVETNAKIITEGLTYAQGALERSSESASAQFRLAGGGLAEFGEKVGELLLPAVTAGTEAFNELLGVVLDFTDRSSATLKGWAEWIQPVFAGAGVLVRNFGAFWTIVQLRIAAFVTNTIAYVGVLPQNFVIVTTYIRDNWIDLLQDLVNLTKTAFVNLLDNAKRFGQAFWDAGKGKGFHFEFTDLLKGFERTSKEFPELIKPELVDVQDQVNQVLEDVTRKETDRLLSLQKAGPPKKPGVAAEPAKAAEYRLAAAVDVRSREAYSAIARNAAGGAQSTTGAVKDMHGTIKQMNNGVQQLVAATKAPAGKPALVVK